MAIVSESTLQRQGYRKNESFLVMPISSENGLIQKIMVPLKILMEYD
jgi:hypothetical protein